MVVGHRATHRPAEQDQLVVQRACRREQELMRIGAGRDLAALDGPPYDDRRAFVAIYPEPRERLGVRRFTRWREDGGHWAGGQW
jgi:hypothetical protein